MTAGPRRASRGLWGETWRRYMRNPVRVAGAGASLLILVSSLLAPLLAPMRYDLANIAEALQRPSVGHWLGTDAIGRDVLSRLLYGGRTSLEVALTVVALAVVEITTALPALLLAMLLISVLGSGLANLIIALAAVAWIEPCRLMRAQTLALRDREFVEASWGLGATSAHLVWRHILPNALGPLTAVVTLGIARTIFAEASLSFLGLGINDPLPSWGKMVSESVAYLQVYPVLGIAPAVMIAFTVLTLTGVGDGLRDALASSTGSGLG
ncbi:MAG: ABC transporter permease [Bacillati bacterium ANGP1]|uniref:ABC transporter permease n=1 Tax=Candidatus Segetimicrobium genomatis TaxID=2569760 RepID=A0A537J214_9BACT|nr:MAG: ABC transporter permease [Terrabacteria group bacterium ANGP1]